MKKKRRYKKRLGAKKKKKKRCVGEQPNATGGTRKSAKKRKRGGGHAPMREKETNSVSQTKTKKTKRGTRWGDDLVDGRRNWFTGRSVRARPGRKRNKERKKGVSVGRRGDLAVTLGKRGVARPEKGKKE